jgi:hypothetical protein
MLCDATPRDKRRSAARKVEHDVADFENRRQRVPQPLVSAWPMNRETSHHALVSVVRCEVKVTSIGVVVAKLPVIRFGLSQMLAEGITHVLARNAGKRASVETLEIDIEAHGVAQRISSRTAAEACADCNSDDRTLINGQLRGVAAIACTALLADFFIANNMMRPGLYAKGVYRCGCGDALMSYKSDYDYDKELTHVHEVQSGDPSSLSAIASATAEGPSPRKPDS